MVQQTISPVAERLPVVAANDLPPQDEAATGLRARLFGMIGDVATAVGAAVRAVPAIAHELHQIGALDELAAGADRLSGRGRRVLAHAGVTALHSAAQAHREQADGATRGEATLGALFAAGHYLLVRTVSGDREH